jgi:hypothetical protein
MKKTFLPLFAALLLAGCGSAPAAPKAEECGSSGGKTDIRGSITALSETPPGDDGEPKRTGILLIEGEKAEDTELDRAQVAVTEETRLCRRRGTKTVPADVQALKKGMRVEAGFTGPLLESDPPRATAEWVLILEE